MKIIIIILQAILNLVRKRRDLIANRSKIPPEYRDDVVVWYSPKKQRLTNYDVIEAYVEDFTTWHYLSSRGTATVTTNKIIITKSFSNIQNIIEDNKSPYDDIKIYVTGISKDNPLTVNQYVDNKWVRLHTYTTDGIYIIKNRNLYVGFGTYITDNCNITITQLPTSILQDLSGNGNHAYLYGGKGKLNSGIGLYTYDYNSDRWSSTGRADYIITKKGFEFTNIIEDGGIIYALGSNIAKEGDKVKVKISGIPNGGRVYFGTWITATEDGEYLGTYAYDNNGNTTIGTLGCIGATITLEFIPDYPDQLCYDGKMYAVAYDMPILTDYTIIADRTWFKDKINSWSYFADKKKAFTFEKTSNGKSFHAMSFAAETAIELQKDGVSYQTKASYNGNVIYYHGDQADNGDMLVIGSTKDSLGNQCFIGCHDDIIILKRSLTINEINDITKAIFNETIIEEQTNNTSKP